MRRRASAPPAPVAPVAATATFTRDELAAIQYALNSCPPNRLYAPWMAAERRVRQLLEALR